MKTKVCINCNVEKFLEDFSTRKDSPDGYRNQCKACRTSKECTRYSLNKGVILNKRRSQYQKDKKIILAKCKIRQKRFPEKLKASMDKYRAANRPKENARRRIMKHVYKGKVKRLPCQICGNKKVDAHHCDYSKPLDVMWLCKTHHAAWHRVFQVEE